MPVSVLSGAVLGIDAYKVEVEVDISSGLPSFDLVGLPEGAVRESKVRVRSALKNSGFPHPVNSRRITVNLAPADIRKGGTAFDLPIALGLLGAFGFIPPSEFLEGVFVGELALSGELKPIRGALSIASMAKDEGYKRLFLPLANAAEASVVGGIEVHGIHSLGELVDFLRGEIELLPVEWCAETEVPGSFELDLSDVKGQYFAKRALEVAAAGNHNLLMLGPPGAGKTMLARRLISILPPLSFEESLETTKIYSVSGLLGSRGLIRERPFRSPHHTISDAGLVGGGAVPRPGEISLAHNGVLFLDELPEFRKNVLEVLRQPLEERRVVISRASVSLEYPANFLLVAAMNPCPCGAPNGECSCRFQEVQRYRNRISGPLLDRIDLQIFVPSVPFSDLKGRELGESSAQVRERVFRARERQADRFRGLSIKNNSEMGARHLREFCPLDSSSLQILERAISKLGMSARAYHRIIKVARTIADLEGSEDIAPPHIAEAVNYRSLDRNLNELKLSA